MIVLFLEAVEMHRQGQVRARRELIELLFQEQRVGAEIDELLARNDAFHDLHDLLVQQGLAAGNGDDRRAALVHGLEALFRREALIENGIRIVDLAATGASEVAAE